MATRSTKKKKSTKKNSASSEPAVAQTDDQQPGRRPALPHHLQGDPGPVAEPEVVRALLPDDLQTL